MGKLEALGDAVTKNILIMDDRAQCIVSMAPDVAKRIAVEIFMTLGQHPEEPTKQRLSALQPVEGHLSRLPNGDWQIVYRMNCGLEMAVGIPSTQALAWAQTVLDDPRPEVH